MTGYTNREKLHSVDVDEVASNKYTLRCMIIMTGFIALTVVLNILNIFIIQSSLMYLGLLGGVVCTILGAIVMAVVPDKSYTKYLLLIIIVLYSTVAGTFLTYHTILVCIIPLLCSAQYKNNRVIMFTYFISAASIVIMVMTGFYFGLCDANMLVLTNQVCENHIDPVTGEFLLTKVNDNPWGTLPLYYALPRCLVLLAAVPIIRRISDVISRNARRETELRILGEMDMMTQLYNRNKYLEMLNDYYPKIDTVGVMFWDINGLKEVNDSMGHDSGDYLISSITSSITQFMDERCKGYRIGGDEFVVIGEGLTREEMGEMVVKSQNSIAKKDKVSIISISAAVGYTVGAGKDIEKLVSDADAIMYKNKKLHYEELEKAKEAGV